MQFNHLRTLHPLALLLVVTIMALSLLISALWAGMIYPNRAATGQIVEQSEQKGAITLTQSSNTQNVVRSREKAIYMPAYKNVSRVKAEPIIQLNPSRGNEIMCTDCGEIISINQPKQHGLSYMVKVRMVDGSYRTISQYCSQFCGLDFSAGDAVRLNSRKFTMA